MSRPEPSPAECVLIVRQALTESGLQFEEPASGSFVAELPGQKRLKTSCWFVVGQQTLAVEAFVMRKPDENVDQVHRWLLAHSAKMFAVAWAIDDVGDIYLSGRLPLAAVTVDVVDRVLGAVLDYADSAFNTLLELGFGESIRREWAWRESRGESLANLAAFEGFVKRDG
ncbi:MAG TPA: YbjN domain-containing protein [Jatrophihabitans sp.]|nr:YbjN domain-containing protein [Jatrophihabitans sp.]